MLKIVLTNPEEHTGPLEFHLLTQRAYRVGREEGDIILKDDQSVSKVHAELTAEHPGGNWSEPLLIPSLSVVDLHSKSGTYATERCIQLGNPISASERITLACGDKIRFGKMWSEFQIQYTPLVVAASVYKLPEECRERIGKLGGHIYEESEWDDKITHVVMETVTLTNKAVCALLSAKPIIRPLYIFHLLSAIETGEPWPDPNNYVPPFGENFTIKISPDLLRMNPARTALFAGKTFLFCSEKRMRRLKPAVKAGGGTVKNIASALRENVANDEFIIVTTKDDIVDRIAKSPSVKTLLDIYQSAGKRFVEEYEFGFAALFSSINKYCNPDWNGEMLPSQVEALPRYSRPAAANGDQPREVEVITIDDDDDDTNDVPVSALEVRNAQQRQNHEKKDCDDNDDDDDEIECLGTPSAPNAATSDGQGKGLDEHCNRKVVELDEDQVEYVDLDSPGTPTLPICRNQNTTNSVEKDSANSRISDGDQEIEYIEVASPASNSSSHDELEEVNEEEEYLDCSKMDDGQIDVSTSLIPKSPLQEQESEEQEQSDCNIPSNDQIDVVLPVMRKSPPQEREQDIVDQRECGPNNDYDNGRSSFHGKREIGEVEVDKEADEEAQLKRSKLDDCGA